MMKRGQRIKTEQAIEFTTPQLFHTVRRYIRGFGDQIKASKGRKGP